jgi:hypothetical protein
MGDFVYPSSFIGLLKNKGTGDCQNGKENTPHVLYTFIVKNGKTPILTRYTLETSTRNATYWSG